MQISRVAAKLVAIACAGAVAVTTWALTFEFAPHLFQGPSHEWGWYVFLMAVVLSMITLVATYKVVFSALVAWDRS